jgi:glycosyltransferase involved in cell wall biosynthesis
VRVIYNGIDYGHYSEPYDASSLKSRAGLDSGGPVVGCIARLDPVKNHALLFRAFKRVLQVFPDARLAVIGGGSELERLSALAQSLGIAGNVAFLGAQKNIREYLHICDVLALPSLSEGMPIALIEALAAGVAVVSTKVGGIPELISDCEHGYLVENNNDVEMANRIIKLLQDEKIRKYFRKNGQERVREFFNIDKTVGEYTELYSSLVS